MYILVRWQPSELSRRVTDATAIARKLHSSSVCVLVPSYCRDASTFMRRRIRSGPHAAASVVVEVRTRPLLVASRCLVTAECAIPRKGIIILCVAARLLRRRGRCFTACLVLRGRQQSLGAAYFAWVLPIRDCFKFFIGRTVSDRKRVWTGRCRRNFCRTIVPSLATFKPHPDGAPLLIGQGIVCCNCWE